MIRRGFASVSLFALGLALPAHVAKAQEAPTQLAPVVVEGQGGTGDENGFNGYAPQATVSATKGEAPLNKTPQAVSSVGAQQIADQAARSVVEAARYSPGIRAETFGSELRNDWFLIRGYTSQENSYFLDGLQLQSASFAYWKINPYLVERIDILRGPSGALYGGSNPGGLINLVSKRPQFRNGGEISVGINEFGNVWTGFDVQGTSEDGVFGWRFAGTGNIGDTEVDYVDNDQVAFLPSVTWRPNADTSLNVYAHYSKSKTRTTGFLPYLGTEQEAPFGYIPREFYPGEPDADRLTREQAMIGYEFEHSFNENVSVRQNLRYAQLSIDYLGVYGLGYAAAPTAGSALLNRGALLSRPEIGIFNVDNQVEFTNSFGAAENTLLVGLDYKHFDFDDGLTFTGIAPIDILNPNYGSPVTLAEPTNANTTQQQLGLYVQNRTDIDRLSVLLSGRYDTVSTETATSDENDDALSGRAGLIYRFDNGITPYASAARSFLPVVGSDGVTGEAFSPETGTQYEAGVRYQPDAWNGGYIGAAVFDLTRSNVVSSSAAFVNRQIGKSNSQGFELEAAMNLTPGLKLLAAYTAYDFEITETNNPVELGKVATAVPEQFGSIWLDYTVEGGRFEGLGFGAGLRYVGSSWADAGNTLKVDDAVVADAALRFERGQFGAALNVSNIFDTRYVGSCSSPTGCYYAEGREASLTLTYKW